MSINNRILSNLESNIAWNLTLKSIDNQNTFSCLPGNNPLACSGNKWKTANTQKFIFQLFDSEGNRYPHKVNTESNVDNNYGLTFNGIECVGFDPIAGNDLCPIQVQTSWRPSLSIGSVLDFSMILTTEFVYKPKSNDYMINTNNLSFEIEKNSPFAVNTVKKSGRVSANPNNATVTSAGAGGNYSLQQVVLENVMLDSGMLLINGNIASEYSKILTSMGSVSESSITIKLIDPSSLVPPNNQEPCVKKSMYNTIHPEAQLLSASCVLLISSSGKYPPGNYNIQLIHNVNLNNPVPSAQPVIKKTVLDYSLVSSK